MPRGGFLVEFKLAYDPKLRRLYLKQEIADMIAKDDKKIVRCVANAEAAIIFDEETNYENVLRSIETLKLDLMQRMEKQNRENTE